MENKIIFAWLFILCICFCSASTTVTYPSPVMVVLNSNLTSQVIEFENDNMSMPVTVTLALSSSISTVAQLSSSSVYIAHLGSSTISIKSGASYGAYTGVISYSSSDGNSGTIPVSITIPQPPTTPVTAVCPLDIFPTMLTNVKIKQGEIKTRTIQLTVPSCYPSTVKIQGVSLATDEKPIMLGELSLGIISPGNSVQIPIEIDSNGVSTGQYSDTLQLLLYNASGIKIEVPQISVSVLVSVGIQPTSNFSLSDLPVCSLNSIDMSLNTSYRMTCTQTPNIEIRPVIDHTMIKGLSVEESATNYIYLFQPLKIGTTLFSAEFLNKNAPLGTPFEQEIRINQGNIPLPGTQMAFEFIPLLESAQDGEIIIVHAIDNKTNSYINNANLYLDGNLINGSFQIKTDKNYTLRAVANGYQDYIRYVYINPKSILFNMSSSNPVAGDAFTITTMPENCTIFMDGVKQNYATIFPLAGVHEFEAICEGYKNTKINVTFLDQIRVISQNEEFNKGEMQIILLSANATYQISYAKDGAAQFSPISSGIGEKITFTPDKVGIYTIIADGKEIYRNEIKGNSIITFFAKYWLYFVIAIVLLGGLILIISRLSSSRGASYLPKSLGGATGGGLVEVTQEI